MGSVIQATGTVDFEDGLWIGNHLKTRNGLQIVCTIPGVQPGVVYTPGFLRGQTEFQSAWSAWLLGVKPGTRFNLNGYLGAGIM